MKFVKAEKPVTTKHADLGEISVEVEVPQVESLDEAVQFCGGEQGLLDYLNSNIETAAKNGGRAALRNAPKDANVDELKNKVIDLVRKYSPETSAERGPSKAKKAEAFDKVAELVNSGKEFTREELLAMLAAAK
jgi:hypothetical protein